MEYESPEKQEREQTVSILFRWYLTKYLLAYS